MITRAINPILHFEDEHGHPLVGGLLCTFVAGTSTPVKTYKDEIGTPNETQVRLDSRGEAAVFLDSSMAYKFVVLDKNGSLAIPPIDNVTANTRTFTASGADGITVQEEVVDGRTVLHFGIADNSITKDKLHNPRELIVDAETMEMVAKDIGGRKYVVLKSKGGAGGVTQEYVDDAIEQESEQRQTAISQVSQMIPTKTSQLQNDSGFVGNERKTEIRSCSLVGNTNIGIFADYSIPSEYVIAEYIKSNSSNFIDTLISGNRTDIASIDVTWYADTIVDYTPIFSSYMDENHKVTRLIMSTASASNYMLFGLNSDPSGSINVGNYIRKINRTIVSLTPTGDPYAFNNYSASSEVSVGTKETQSNTIKLFDRMSKSAGLRLYKFVIWGNGDTNAIIDLVPVVRAADGKAGFFDYVSKQFFTCDGLYAEGTRNLMATMLITPPLTYNKKYRLVSKNGFIGWEEE